MKTLYGLSDCAYPLKVVLTDDILARIEYFRNLITKTTAAINDSPWEERLEATIRYGVFKVVPVFGEEDTYEHVATAEGPVLKYGGNDCGDGRPCADEVVWIKVFASGSIIEQLGHEGSDYVMDFEDTIENIPDVYFSGDFINHAVADKRLRDKHIKTILEGMIDEHRQQLEKAIEERQRKRLTVG